MSTLGGRDPYPDNDVDEEEDRDHDPDSEEGGEDDDDDLEEEGDDNEDDDDNDDNEEAGRDEDDDPDEGEETETEDENPEGEGGELRYDVGGVNEDAMEEGEDEDDEDEDEELAEEEKDDEMEGPPSEGTDGEERQAEDDSNTDEREDGAPEPVRRAHPMGGDGPPHDRHEDEEEEEEDDDDHDNGSEASSNARRRDDDDDGHGNRDEEEGQEADDYPPDGQLKPAASGDAMDEEDDDDDDQGRDGEEGPEGGGEATDADADADAAASAAAGGLARLQEASYSTRGRGAGGDPMDPLERLAREALGVESATTSAAPKDKDRESFLNDAITEEERRTRTRYIPAVDGMHALRKHEIKSDLALARALSGGGAAAAASKPKARRGNSMDVDADEATSVDEDRSDVPRTASTRAVDIGSTGMVIPSPAFVSPPASGDSRQAPTPSEVDEVTAFNPPRPPESVGPKKKHRMLRWERRPADIEVDLNNYRKTVHRTRDELRRAQEERDRLWTVDNHLSRNFLLHLDAMSKEWKRLNEELAAVQQECVNSADLLTSRTRSRGAGKGSYAMRDVLAVLRSRGQEIEAKGLTVPQNASVGDSALSGLGGVNCVSFEDWHRDTKIVPTSIASCWLLPGDAVVSPYGDGVVVAVYGADPIDVTAAPHPDLTVKGGLMDRDSMEIDSVSPEKGGKPEPGNETTGGAIATRQGLVAPRVAVRLPFGVGYFPPGALISKEDPTAYSDARLALRWKGILDTGLAMGSFLDIAAMSEPSNLYRDGANSEEDGSQDLDNSEDRVRLLPFGSRMLPTCNGRGVGLFNMTPEVLDEEIDLKMLQGCAVLGRKDNPGVPNEVRKVEDENQEEITLRARALQLRNELYRQKRVRMLNERTYASTQERAVRVESLVAEMRTDLKTLKRRLDEEVSELGITESEAEGILSAYYRSLDSHLSGEASPQKRPRRQSRLDSDNDAMEEDAEQAEGFATDLVGQSR